MELFTTLTFVYLTQLCSCSLDALNPFASDPDTKRNVTELISSKGYPVEDYTVQTKDGYLLSVQRIPHGRNESHIHAGKKPAVFLQHGLLSSAVDWVINFPNQSLGFILADAGYDVWLGNTRGNTYSRRHIQLDPNKKEFWNFSFNEMGEYDLPAVIDFALNVTGNQQLYYVGHSQGTTSMFVLLSEKPEYNEKVKIFIALAPVAYVGHVKTAVRHLAPFANDINFLFELLGVGELLPSSRAMKLLSGIVCKTELKIICENILFLWSGPESSQLNKTRLGVYTSHSPAGASTQSVVHYAQMVNSKKFQKFDYGKSGNRKHYNQAHPPNYQLEKITTPIELLWSKDDELADPTDVGLLQKKLQSLISSYRVKFDSFSHIDFVWGIDANELVYKEVTTMLQKQSVS